MSILLEMPAAARWLLSLAVSATILVIASTYDRRSARAGHRSSPTLLSGTAQLLAYSVLAVMWMWTLEPIRFVAVRVLMSIVLALGIGSLLYAHPRTSPAPAISRLSSAGMLLGILTTVVLIAQ